MSSIFPEAPTVDTTALADLIDKARETIARNGFHQGDLYDPQQAKGAPVKDCRVDIIGALYIAIYGEPRARAATEHTVALVDAAMREITATAGGVWIVDYNDAPGRTASEVQQTLTDTAQRLRGEAK